MSSRETAIDEFDVVVVGSGFGGSVTACRLAEAGRSVCVLERGKPYPPNSFARTPYELGRNFWDPSGGRYGLFNVWSFDHMDAIVSAGLGGGSLIYANVLIRKDENWFVTETAEGPRPWPISRSDLDPYYDSAEAMLDAQVFPLGKLGFERVRKAEEFRQAAGRLGFAETTHDQVDPKARQWYLPLLAVSFANHGHAAVPGECLKEEVRNLHDRDRQTCRLCGECDVGCNYGAKNTLDYTYLTIACAHRAVIRTLAEVKRFAPATGGGGFLVDYVQHHDAGDVGAEAPGGPTVQIRARHLVLSAGALGSTYLLLSNCEALPPLPMLGHLFSGNGDLLTVALEAHTTGADGKRTPRIMQPSRGPVITSTMRSPDEADGAAGSRGFYLQDAGYPGFLDLVVQMAQVRKELGHVATFILHRLRSHLFHRGGADLAPDLEGLLSDPELSVGSMPLLGMGRDVPDGVFQLDDDGRLALDWRKDRSEAFFSQVTAAARGVARELDARFIQDPLTEFFGRLITVHPLGGCPMGASASEGVVDSYGRVHGVPNLHVMDGSILPGPVGANPSLTIAAVAERAAEQMVADTKP